MAAISDTAAAEAAFQKTEMTVQISTKLNRNHAVIGEEALILPTMGRTEIDMQASGAQIPLGRGLRVRGASDARQG